MPDDLGAVTLAASSRAKKKCVFSASDPCGSNGCEPGDDSLRLANTYKHRQELYFKQISNRKK